MRDKEEIEKIINAHKNGCSYRQIEKMFNISKSTIAYYCNEKKSNNIIERLNKCKKQNEEYEELICSLVKESDNINQVCIKLNKRPTNNNYKKINEIIEKYQIDTSHFTNANSFSKKIIYYSDDEIFSNREKMYNIHLLKKRLFNGKYKEYKCEKCGINSWMGNIISLQIHHINGNRYDNRLENLQVLCPNCHSQTDNFCKKKTK